MIRWTLQLSRGPWGDSENGQWATVLKITTAYACFFSELLNAKNKFHLGLGIYRGMNIKPGDHLNGW
jgi:hypothetical protein